MRFLIPILILMFWSCNPSRNIEQVDHLTSKVDSFESLVGDYLLNQAAQYERIDSLLNFVFHSEFSLCNFYDYSAEYYISKGKKPGKPLDELLMLHNLSIKNERYIYQKILRNRDYQNNDQKKKWYDCLMLFPKKDCEDGDFYHRMNRLPYILRDTSDLKNSIEVLDHIADILRERCGTNSYFLRKEVEWRNKLYHSAKSHIPLLEGEYEEYIEDVHWLFRYLPDSLSTDFAYNYIINNDISGNRLERSDYLFDIIDERAFNRNKGFSEYMGTNIYLIKIQISRLIDKAEKIKESTECDWCETFIKRMEYANAHH